MAVTSETSKVRYLGNGVTTSFPFSFRVFKPTDLEVTLQDVNGAEETLILDTDYTVTLNADGTGSVAYPKPGSGRSTLAGDGVTEASSAKLVITRRLPMTQLARLRNQGGYYPEVVEEALDRLAMIAQQLFELVHRTIKFPVSDPVLDATVPPIEQRKNKGLRFNSDGSIGVTQHDPDAAVSQAAASAQSAASSAAAASSSEANAAAAALTATDAAAAAAASAATINLPALAGAAKKLLRVLADETGYEHIGLSDFVAGLLASADADAFLGAMNRTIAAGAGLAGGGDLSADRTLSVIVPLGQCRLTLESGNLKLSRYNGRFLFIGSVNHEIPQEGVTLPPTGLTPDTTYNIYAYMDSGTMKLEASTTPPTVYFETGVKVKAVAGGQNYTLVGMARTIAGPAWVDSTTQLFVLSYFNRRAKPVVGANTNGATTTSTSPVELTTNAGAWFLTWGDETVFAEVVGNASCGGSQFTTAAIGLDGAVVGATSTAHSEDGGNWHTHIARYTAALAETYHYITPMGALSGGPTPASFKVQVRATIMG